MIVQMDHVMDNGQVDREMGGVNGQ